MEEILISIFLICAHFLYMFWANYSFQLITDHFDDIFVAAWVLIIFLSSFWYKYFHWCLIILNVLSCRYAIPWYIAPMRIQKFIMFLLQRGTKNYVLKIGGLFTGSLEGFATVISISNQYKQYNDFHLLIFLSLSDIICILAVKYVFIILHYDLYCAIILRSYYIETWNNSC